MLCVAEKICKVKFSKNIGENDFEKIYSKHPGSIYVYSCNRFPTIRYVAIHDQAHHIAIVFLCVSSMITWTADILMLPACSGLRISEMRSKCCSICENFYLVKITCYSYSNSYLVRKKLP